MSEEETMDWAKQRKEEEAGRRQNSLNKPTEEKNHSHMKTTAEEGKMKTSKQNKKRERRASYTDTK